MKTVKSEQLVREKGEGRREKKISSNFRTNRSLPAYLLPFTFYLLLCIVHCALCIGCNEPVYYELSTQVKIRPARISGSPTAFAEINGIAYVASGKDIHYYEASSDNWGKVINLNLGRITFLAGTDSNLYVLANNKLFASSTPGTASSYSEIEIPGYRLLTMYPANNEIFIGARKNDSQTYSIFHISGNIPKEINGVGELVPIGEDRYIVTNFGLLNGAAFDGTNYFLSVKDTYVTNNGCVYFYNGTNASVIPDIENQGYNIPFMGIVAIDGFVYAIRRNNGAIFEVKSDLIKPVKVLSDDQTTEIDLITGRISNGVLFVWTDPSDESGNTRLLLAGRQDYLQYSTSSGYTYGYLEVELESDGSIKSNGRFREPGVTVAETVIPSTLERGRGHNDRYKTTLGTYPVKFFYQANDVNKTLFASTHQNGVWSLRERDKNEIYWNTEEE